MKIKPINRIDDTTPECVLKELSFILGIKKYNRKKLIRIMVKFPGWEISNNYQNNKKDLRIIARIMNPGHAWKRQELLKAFEFSQSFTNHVDMTKFTNLFDKNILGLPTTKTPESFSCCMLYRICQNLQISVNINTTDQQMLDQIKLFFTGNWLHLQQELFQKIRYGTKQELIDLAIAGGYDLNKYIGHKSDEISITEYTYDELERVAREIGSRKIAPESDIEAIVLAARDYQLDFTCCQSPLQEYQNLVQSKEIPWFPQDSVLKSRLAQSSDKPYLLINRRLNQNFNGQLPSNMYHRDALVELCEFESIRLKPEDNPYTELQMSVLAANFHHSRQGNITNTSNTFFEDFSELNSHEIVVYGISYEIDTPLVAFTYGELSDAFSNYDNFINPINGEVFSQPSIDKLQKLTEFPQWSDEPDDVYHERRNLSDQIERIKIYNASKNRIIDQLVDMYSYLSEEQQSQVNDIFVNLLHSGMYMRNWDGVGPYPLESISTNFPPSEQILVDHRVTQSLIVLEKACQAVPEIGDYILDLPLMEYNRGTGKFITVSNSNEGLTVRQRIAIVRRGENQDGVSSCIRLSSNKFCATAYYYMILLGFHLPFKMTEVSHIF